MALVGLSVRLLTALALVAAMSSPENPPADPTPLSVITVGTSIEFGTHLPVGQSWPRRLAERAPGYVFTDNSLPGGAWTNANSDGATIRTKLDEAIALHPDVLIVGGPVNDLVSLNDVTPLRQAVFEGVSAAYAAGIPKVVVMGIFPFNDGAAFQPGWWPSLEPRRIAYNTWAKQMYGAAFVDLTWCIHETTTQRGDNRFFKDGLHPNRVGAALLAECFPLDALAV